MDLRFVSPELRRLDLAGTEVLLACLAEDERPPQGVAGLVDWRLAGDLSKLLQAGFATGNLGEVLLIPGRPKLPFDKVVLFGTGEIARFDDRAFELVVKKMLSTLEGLRVRSAVVELPGRHFSGIEPQRAVSMLQDIAVGHSNHDVWTLVETAEAQRAIQKQLVTERRRLQ